MMESIGEIIKEYSRPRKKTTLKPMKRLLSLLGNPERDLKVIHVAGTNGKGSVCRMVSAMLEENDYRVGLFTSPHVERFTERIEYNGAEISDDDLNRFTQRALKGARLMAEKDQEFPTEFDLITAIALLYFQSKKPDFVILEVGLGGKWDSTNIIENPCITLITSIDFDHMNRLGHTLEAIATEKAGIIKAGVPVVSHVEDSPAAKVVAKVAYEKNSLFTDVSKMSYTLENFTLKGQCFSCEIKGKGYRHVSLGMLGEHQIANALTALTAIEILSKNSIIKVEKEALYRGLGKARQKGRLEQIGQDPPLILDGGHNRQSMESVVRFAGDYFYGQKILTVIGALEDKPVEEMMELALHLGRDFIVTQPVHENAYPAESLDQWLRQRGKNSQVIKGIDQLVKRIKKEHGEKSYQGILVVGSFYLIGDIRSAYNDEY